MPKADAKSDLRKYWEHWGLDDASLIGDFAMLPSNVQNDPKRDSVTDVTAASRTPYRKPIGINRGFSIRLQFDSNRRRDNR